MMAHPTTTLPSYCYSALSATDSEIRLLQLGHTNGDFTKLSFELLIFPLIDAPSYHALSYTWGPPEDVEQQTNSAPAPEHFIQISDSLLKIEDNLHQWICQLHERRRSVSSASTGDCNLVWIDALCINQQDIKERSQQVTLMDRIYSQAAHVLIWLGPADSLEIMAVNYMSHRLTDLALHLNRVTKAGESWLHAIDDGLDGYLHQFNLPVQTNVAWEVFFRFFKRRWFSRVWIIQEVALARSIKVWCGSLELHWIMIEICGKLLKNGLEAMIIGTNAVENGVEGFIELVSRNATLISAFQRWCSSGKIGSSHLEIYCALTGREHYEAQYCASTLLLLTWSAFSSTDPRDKIFGVLGVLKRLTHSEQLLVNVDYSMDLVSLVIETTTALLNQTGWLGLLCLRGLDTANMIVGLPSWTVDITSPLRVTPLCFEKYNVHREKGDIKLQENLEFKISANMLRLTAHKVGIIDAISDSLEDIVDRNCDMEHLCQVTLGAMAEYSITKESRIEVLWKTMIGNHPKEGSMEQSRDAFRNWWRLSLLHRAVVAAKAGVTAEEHFKNIPNVELLHIADDTGLIAGHDAIEDDMAQLMTGKPISTELDDESTHFKHAFGRLATGRSVFRTKEGHIGMGHKTVRTGDEVWILPRAFVPVVLRRLSEDSIGSRYQLVGECYIHGIMDGEFFEHGAPASTNIEIV